jgi:hypothetical protein
METKRPGRPKGFKPIHGRTKGGFFSTGTPTRRPYSLLALCLIQDAIEHNDVDWLEKTGLYWMDLMEYPKGWLRDKISQLSRL